jgi:predicted transcriptional regulator
VSAKVSLTDSRSSAPTLSYRLCYHPVVTQREKRSISLPPELAQAVDEAARAEGTTFSGWLAQTAARRLKLEAARQAITEWENENGAFTPEELTEGRAWARELLDRGDEGAVARQQAS